MKSEIWLPILTLALGWAGALGTEMFRDRWASERERQASERERQARQAELQRSTLLELQDALRELYDLASAVDLAAFVVMLENAREITSSPDAKRAAEEEATRAKDRFREAEAKVVLLISRVQDELARRSATMFRIAADRVLIRDPSEDVDVTGLSKIHEPYGKAIDLLGTLIRERY